MHAYALQLFANRDELDSPGALMRLPTLAVAVMAAVLTVPAAGSRSNADSVTFFVVGIPT